MNICTGIHGEEMREVIRTLKHWTVQSELIYALVPHVEERVESISTATL